MDSRTYDLVTSPSGEPGIRCRVCGRTSYHPKDIEQRYCGNCHQWHDILRLGSACAPVVQQVNAEEERKIRG